MKYRIIIIFFLLFFSGCYYKYNINYEILNEDGKIEKGEINVDNSEYIKIRVYSPSKLQNLRFDKSMFNEYTIISNVNEIIFIKKIEVKNESEKKKIKNFNN